MCKMKNERVLVLVLVYTHIITAVHTVSFLFSDLIFLDLITVLVLNYISSTVFIIVSNGTNHNNSAAAPNTNSNSIENNNIILPISCYSIDRFSLVRLLISTLNELGYKNSSNILQSESGGINSSTNDFEQFQSNFL